VKNKKPKKTMKINDLLKTIFSLLFTTVIFAATINVNPGDSIQDALDNANPGDTIVVHAGYYEERLNINNSGSSGGGFITLMANYGDDVYLSGGGKFDTTNPNMIYAENPSYIKIIGLNICSNVARNSTLNGSGILIEGYGSHIQVISNKIYEMRCRNGGDYGAMGIAFYGTETTPFSDIIISDNEIFDCEPADSEALNLDGNVTGFIISNNYIHDVNNIGICMIGGEADINANFGARNGICADNVVKRARSSYGGGYGAAIYSDGGQNIVIERNIVSESDLGIECGCENSGWVSSNITVRNNLIYLNDKIGIGFGGYDASRGRVKDSKIINNSFYKNNEINYGAGDFHGEIVVQFSENVELKNNIIYVSEKGDKRAILEEDAAGNVNNSFDNNIYFCDSTPVMFQWKGTDYNSFSTYKTAANPNEANSLFVNPQFLDAALNNFYLLSNSPAINSGANLNWTSSDIDFAGNPRIIDSKVDIGAYEFVPSYTNPPAVPTGLTASDGTKLDSVEINWSSAARATSYLIFRNTTNLTSSANIIADKVGLGSFSDTSVTAAVTYFYWAKAVNNAGTSDFSNVDTGFSSSTLNVTASEWKINGKRTKLTGKEISPLLSSYLKDGFGIGLLDVEEAHQLSTKNNKVWKYKYEDKTVKIIYKEIFKKKKQIYKTKLIYKFKTNSGKTIPESFTIYVKSQ